MQPYSIMYLFNFLINFFFVEFQHMTFTPDDNSLLSNQDVNQFFGIGND